MREYELVLIFNSSLSADQRKKLLDTVKEWLRDVTIEKVNEWGAKALAYPIKREKIGYYVMLELKAETIPGDLEKRLLNNDQVMRHLLVRKK